MDGRNCSAIEAAGQTRQGCGAKVRSATFKPEPSTNQAWIAPLEEFGTMSAPRGPSPTFLCKSIIPGQLFLIFCKNIILKGLAEACFGE